MNVSSTKLQRRRFRHSSPLKTSFFLPRSLFVLSARPGAVRNIGKSFLLSIPLSPPPHALPGVRQVHPLLFTMSGLKNK